MLLVSAGFKTAILGPQSFADIFNGGEIRVFAGVRTTSADLAEPSRPLGVIRRLGALTGLEFAQAREFAVAAPNDRWMLTVLAPGNPVWFRLVAANDAADFAPDAPRIDGDVSLAGGGGDMIVGAAALVPGTSIPIDGFFYTLPPLQSA